MTPDEVIAIVAGLAALGLVVGALIVAALGSLVDLEERNGR
jgi:hypothetical protein